jgi:hypothetical protein
MKPGLTTTVGAASAVACTASLLLVAALPANAQVAAAAPAASPAAALGADAASPRLVTVSAVVTSLKDTGGGTLRAAINAVNRQNSTTVTTITFAKAGTIKLGRNLPPIKNKVIIDGTSAPGYVTGGAPVVGINGNGHTTLRLDPGSGGSQILGLSVTNSSGNGITLASGSNTVNYNYVGLTTGGKASGNRGDGIFLARTAKKNKIGLNPTNTPSAVANVVSGNRGAGIRLIGASLNKIQSNRVGTNAAGTKAVANKHGGVELIGASKNEIGGNVTGTGPSGPNNPTGTEGSVPEVYVAPPLGNVISGNTNDGVLISAGSKKNILQGNFIGTNAAGLAAVANTGNGVRVIDSDGTVFRGCTVTDNPFVYYNVVSGNKKNGLRVTNSDNTVVQANFFGIGMDNTTTVANGGNGMQFDGNSKTPHVGGVIPLGNVAAGNKKNGIEVKDTVSGFITFNTFGGLLAFKGAAPNHGNGLKVTSSGGNNLARTNVFSGNLGNGVELSGNAQGMTLDPNLVGLNTSGAGPLRNGKNGVLVTGNARKNTIGGNNGSVIPQNTFSGNVGYGLVFTGNARDNKVVNTFIGVATGITLPVPNLKGGVLISGKARNNYIGPRTSSQKTNVISGNVGFGVTLTSKTTGNSVIKNNIGLGREGAPVPNSGGTVSNKGKKNKIRNNNTN